MVFNPLAYVREQLAKRVEHHQQRRPPVERRPTDANFAIASAHLVGLLENRDPMPLMREAQSNRQPP